MPKKLVNIAAYWQNDKPGGIGLIYSGDDLDKLGRILEKCLREFLSTTGVERKELTAQMIDQLTHIGSTENVSEQWRFFALINIFCLEAIGVIPTDEYNGIVYVYEV